MNTALITVLLKANKDPTLCASYRPLSQINTDLKIISKTLSQIESIISSLIHSDQTKKIWWISKKKQYKHNHFISRRRKGFWQGQLGLLIRSAGTILFWRIVYSLDQNTLQLTQGCSHHQWYYITTYHTPPPEAPDKDVHSCVIICIIYRTVGRCNTTKQQNYWYHNPQD